MSLLLFPALAVRYEIDVIQWLMSVFAGTGGRYGGQVQLPATTITVRPKVTTTVAAVPSPGVTSVRPIVPGSTPTQTIRLGGSTVQVRTPVAASTTTTPVPAASSAQVQNLRIIQGPNGQIQVQGLLPGKNSMLTCNFEYSLLPFIFYHTLIIEF